MLLFIRNEIFVMKKPIITREIIYSDKEVNCKGYLAYPKSQKSSVPCVLIAHGWEGRNDFSCKKAELLAESGYAGFAIDMYGNAAIGENKTERRALMSPFLQNRASLIQRIQASLQAVQSLKEIDQNKIAALGYCFGGLCVLDLARSGAEILAAISFHGLLTPPDIHFSEDIKAKILILHGYQDPLVPPQQMYQFASEMTEKNVDWQMHMYGQAAHSFTNPLANDDEMGLHYNPIADKRSWVSTESFLKELF